MIDRKSIDKIVVVIVLLAVIVIFGIILFASDKSSHGITRNPQTMKYEKTLFGDEIIDIDIEMPEKQWKKLLVNAISEEYYSADVKVNGKSIEKVGVRAKGNTSLSQVASSESDRYSMKIKFDEYIDGQNFDGLKKLVLNNNYCDATMMKEAICYDMFKFLGADASLYNYAKVSVNGKYIGLYLALEPVEEEFCERNYGDDGGKLYKPDSMEMGGGKGNMKNFDMDKFEKMQPQNSSNANNKNQEQQPPEPPDGENKNQEMQPPEPPNMDNSGNVKNQKRNSQPDGKEERKSNGADLNYTDDNLSSYETIWDGAISDCTVSDKKKVVTALKVLCDKNSNYDEISKYIDVENLAKYMAVHTFSVNLDSLSGNMSHNYYLYENCGMLNIIPWDYNLAFGGFQSGNASDVINFSISWPFKNMEEEDRQLFANLLNCDEFREDYYSNLRKLSNEYVFSGRFNSLVKLLRTKIDKLVKTDPTSFFTYNEYVKAQEMLEKVITLRAKSVLAQIKNKNAKVEVDSGINISVMGAQGGEKHKDNSTTPSLSPIHQKTQN